jgi:hypothetical protein
MLIPATMFLETKIIPVRVRFLKKRISKVVSEV